MVCIVTYYLRLVDEIENLRLQWVHAVRSSYVVYSDVMPTFCFDPIYVM